MLKLKGPVIFFLYNSHLAPSLNPLPKGEAAAGAPKGEAAAGAPKRLEPPAAEPAGGAVSEKVGAEVGAADCPNPPNAPVVGAVEVAGVLPKPPNPPVLAAGCPKRDDPAVAGAADPKRPPAAGAAEGADAPPKKLPPKAGLAATEAEAAAAGAFAPAADPGRSVSFAISLNDF